MSPSSNRSQCLHCAASPPPSPTQHLSRSTRVSELLAASNEPPEFLHDKERADMLRCRSQLLEEKDNLARDLANQRAAYQAALEREAAVLRDLEDMERIFDPVRTLPSEILQRIFVIVRDLEGERVDPSLPLFVSDSLRGCAKAPWNISHVSKRWRQVATGYSALWSCIGVDTSVNFPEGVACLLSLQSLRALGSSSITMSLNIGDFNDATYRLLRSHLFAPVSQWSHLFLTVDYPPALRNLLPLTSVFAALHTVHLHFNHLHIHWAPSALFFSAPQLRTLSGHVCALAQLTVRWCDIKRVHVGMHQSQVIQVKGGDWGKPLRPLMFSSLPVVARVKRATFAGTIDRAELTSAYHLPAPSPPQTTWPYLTALVVKPPQDLVVLKYVVAPGLSSLQVELNPDISVGNIGFVTDFLNASSPRHCSVVLASVHDDAAALVQLMPIISGAVKKIKHACDVVDIQRCELMGVCSNGNLVCGLGFNVVNPAPNDQ